MRINLNRIMGERADTGQRESWIELSEKTGIRRATLYAISRGELKQLRPEHIDALCTHFGVSAGELIEAERVKLPIELNLRNKVELHDPPTEPRPQASRTPTLTTQRVTLEDIERLRKAKRDELKPKETEP